MLCCISLSFSYRATGQHRFSFQLDFKRQGEEGGEGVGEKKSSGLLRFLPDFLRSRLEKSFEEPKEELGYRYQLRLKKPLSADRRHVITRIQRFIPGY